MSREENRRENARRLASKIGGKAEFGRFVGMEASQVSQIMGKNPTKNIGNSIAKRIESVFHLPAGFLDDDHPEMGGSLSGDGEPDNPPSANGADKAAALEAPSTALPVGARRVRAVESEDPTVAHIRKVKLRVSAGVMGFAIDPEYDDGETISMDLRWLAKERLRSDKLVAIAVKGESMEPGLYEDDVVIINTDDDVKKDGAVYLFNYEGEVVVKRLSRDVGEWWLTSDNQDQRRYHRKLCRDRECIIVGRVVKKESTRI